ncbi:MAG: hypothetical protein JJU40_10150 [Rhodobacteraceae bacterium]|nr:hypothetical protein [Paracoccaceae bacterium]
MVTYLLGASVRGVLVALAIMVPSFILPDLAQEARQIAVLVAVVAFCIVLFEYGSSHPGLVEFRFAPPFNRIRYLSLLFCVIAIALLFRQASAPGPASHAVTLVGDVMGRALDVPYSPVQLLVAALADPADRARVELIRAAAGLSYGISLVMLAIFSIFIRVLDWPLGRGAFNLWLNLPTFDPLAQRDVAAHLLRDARFNVVIGLALPFLIPFLAAGAAGVHDLSSVAANQPLLWGVTLWAFLPASLFMRGVAMARLAALLRESASAPRPGAPARTAPAAVTPPR